MKLTITNTGSQAEAIYSPPADWTDAIEAGATFEVTGDADDVVIIGIKPGVLETFEQGVKAIAGAVKTVLEAIVGRKKQARAAGQADDVSMSISNHGGADVRVILGDGVTDVTLVPGTTQSFTADGYLELRELGHAPQQGGTPD